MFRQGFIQNSFISDGERIKTLPIGIENLKIGINGVPRHLSPGASWASRTNNILIGPYSPTHPERNELIKSKLFHSNAFTYVNESVSPSRYRYLTHNHRFVLCPRGNGVDTHRFWETLYRGAVPIVKKTHWSDSLKEYQLPYIEVETFSPDELVEHTELSIRNAQFELFNPVDVHSLWIDYWVTRFRK